MAAPLEGIRVVELASFVAAPACGALLADLGADVIKVEVPWGEIYRHSTPRMVGFESDFPASAPYQMENRGKRSLALDLALPQALEALHKVVDTADVMLTNMLPARLEKNGLDPETLRTARPELIVCRISGFGPDGPDANRPAFDYSTFWARTGIMDQLRDPEAPPAFQRPGFGDHSAAMAMALGVVSALRTRDADGQGQVIDVSLQHIGFYVNGNDVASSLAAGEQPPMHQRKQPRNPLWNHYRTAGDRWLFLVMIESDRYWPEFLRAIERSDLETDERFAGAVPRYQNSRELVEILDATFAQRTLEEWGERLNAHSVIWAPTRTILEATQDPAAREYGSFPTVDHPEFGSFETVAPPMRMSAHDMPATAPAPGLGAHTAEVLAEAGVDAETIALLVEASG
ncbi:CoA transferase [Myxococcota bacterium]|nr:CoA transferase [Myxococcota bacterium]